jgi:hypothetical protein
MITHSNTVCLTSETFGITKDSTAIVDDACINVPATNGRIHTNKIHYANDGFGLTFLQIEVSYNEGANTQLRNSITGYYDVSQPKKAIIFQKDEYIMSLTFYYKSDWVNAILIETNVKVHDLIGVTGTSPITKKITLVGDIVGLKGGSYVNGIQSLTFYYIKNCKLDCKTCTTSLDSCDLCEVDYYRKENTNFPTRCYNNLTVESGFYIDLFAKLIKPCDSTCSTCANASNQCITCKTGYKKFNSDNICYQIQPDGFFLDNSVAPNIYKQCDASCKRCENRSTNCLECNTNCFNRQGQNTNVCYCTKQTNFWLDSSINPKLYKPCVSPCTDCNSPILCLTCFNGFFFKKNYNLDGEICYKLDNPPAANYALNTDLSPNQFEICHIGCATCNKIGISSPKCITCNNANGYYFNFSLKSPDDVCHNTKPISNYYLDNGEKLWKPCSANCSTCNNFGDSKCLTCATDFYKKEINTLEDTCYSKNTAPATNYYLDLTASFWKVCPEKCLTCKLDSSIIKCLTCNKPLLYYFRKNYNINGDDCFKTKPAKTFLNISQFWEDCAIHCSACDDATNCTTCENLYYRKVENAFPTICYKNPLDTYYLKYNVWNKCIEPCINCADGTTINCLSCKSGYYLQENFNTTNGDTCYDKLPVSNYYLDTNAKLYKKCHISCATCNTAGAANCMTCAPNYYQEINKTAPFTCYDTLAKHYIVTDSGVQKWKPCHANCQDCNTDQNSCLKCITGKYMKSGSILPSECRDKKANEFIKENFLHDCHANCAECNNELSESCTKCNETSKFLKEELTIGECIDESNKPTGYYKNTIAKKWSKCDAACSDCTVSGNLQCTSCNINYYKKNGVNEGCYSSPLQGFYLDNAASPKVFKSCDTSCYTCIDSSTDCSSCNNTTYYPKEDNSDKKCRTNISIVDGYYFNSNKFSICRGECSKCTSYNTCTECKSNNYFSWAYINGAWTKPTDLCYPNNTNTKVLISNNLYLISDPCSNFTDKDNFPKCKTCNNASGYYFLTGATSDPSTCYTLVQKAKHYIDSNELKPCVSPCDDCSALNICKSCAANFYRRENDTNGCYALSDGYYLTNNILKSCDSSCKTCQGLGYTCLTCSNGYYFLEDGSGTPKACYTKYTGYYLPNPATFLTKCHTSCGDCLDGQSSTCTSCAINYYKIDNVLTTSFKCHKEDDTEVQYKYVSTAKTPNTWVDCGKTCKKCKNADNMCTECALDFYHQQDKSTPRQCFNFRESHPDGYYFDSTNRYWDKCDTKCGTCQLYNKIICITCATGYNLKEYSAVDNTCYNSKPAENYVLDSNLWKVCHTNCKTCNGIGIKNCLTCSTNYYFKENYNNSGDICYNEKPAYNYALVSNEFKICHAACKTCNNITDSDCLECNTGYYFIDSNPNVNTSKKCFGTFPAENYYLSNNFYKLCDASCKTCTDGTDNCTSCAVNYKKIIDAAATHKCYASNNYPNGYYNDVNNVPVFPKCKTGCATCDDGTLCKTCSTNYKKKSDESNTKYVCYDNASVPDGYYFGSLSDTTLPRCNASCKTCTDGTDSGCTSCAVNYFFKSTENQPSKCFTGDVAQFVLIESSGIKKYNPCSNSCSSDGCIDSIDKCKVKCASTFFPKENTTFPTFCFTSIQDGWLRSEDKSLYLKCHPSCLTCANKIDFCLICAQNYYYTEDNKNSCHNSAPIGYIFNPDLSPKMYVKKNILKINQIEDIELKNIEPSYSGRYTIEFWMMTNNNNLKNGIHVIWKNHVSISINNNESKLVTSCWPRDFLVINLDNTYGADLTNLRSSLKDESANYETPNYNNDWIFIRCAVNHFDKSYYLDVSNNKIRMNMDTDELIPKIKNDIPDRYYWQIGDKSTFKIAGGKKNTLTNIYFRTIALFKDFIPEKMNKFKE